MVCIVQRRVQVVGMALPLNASTQGYDDGCRGRRHRRYVRAAKITAGNIPG